MKTTRQQLLEVLAELSLLFPDWRFGQLVANVAAATPHGTQADRVWECKDDELLAAAQRLLERNRPREQILA